MKISVAIATYNGAKYLAEQLESICNQSVTPDEVVISDDGSTDATCRIAEEFSAKYDGISFNISVNPAPGGSDRNFERAISLASGDVIYLADQDDVWLSDRLEIMQSILSASPLPGAVFCDSRCVDSDLQDLGFTHWQSRGFESADEILTAEERLFSSACRLPDTTWLFRLSSAIYCFHFPNSKTATTPGSDWCFLPSAHGADRRIFP